MPQISHMEIRRPGRALLEALLPELQHALGAFGFGRVEPTLGARARAYMGLKKGGIAFGRRSSQDGRHEFVYFQPGADRLSIACFGGWDPSMERIPNPQSAFDYPDAQRSEFSRASFVFPLFSLLDASGLRLHSRRLEGDDWLLVGGGVTPEGASDEALANGIAAQLQARQMSRSTWESDGRSAAVRALAERIVHDLETSLWPYLLARSQSARPTAACR